MTSLTSPIGATRSQQQPYGIPVKQEDLDDKIADVAVPTLHFLMGTLLGPIKRLIILPVSILAFLKPKLFVGGKFTQLTQENIAAGKIFPPSSLPETMTYPSPERLLYVRNRTIELAKQLAEHYHIDFREDNMLIYSTPEAMGTHAYTLGCHASFSSPALLIDLNLINGPDDELDFVLGHELTHIFANHQFKSVVVSAFIFATDVVAFLLLPPLVFATEGIALLATQVLAKNDEREADRQSIQVLNTQKGATHYFERVMGQLLGVRNATTPEELRKHCDPRLVKKYANMSLSTRKILISPTGRVRQDFVHPGWEERLATASHG